MSTLLPGLHVYALTRWEPADCLMESVLDPVARDLQTSHMNKPSFSTLPHLASGGVGSGLCLSAVLLLSYRRGVWNWPKTTCLPVSRRFSTACREVR